MLLALLTAAAEEAPELGPYVGGGVGVVALVVAVHRISVALDRMTRAVQGQLEAWGEHRRRETEWWADMRKTMDGMAELGRQREAELAAANRYAAEVRALRAELGRVHRDVVPPHRKTS